MSIWVPQRDGPGVRGVGVVRCPEAGGGGGVGDELDQVRGGDPVRWGEYRIRIGWVDGVEADEGVEVHDAAALVFGDLAVGDPQFDAVSAFEGAEGAGEGDHGAAPEFAGPAVPDDVVGVVVAVQAERPAQAGRVLGVPLGADQGVAVGAAGDVAADAAGPHLPRGRVDGAGVHGPEGGCGQGGEHGRVPGHGGGDAFAADEAGFDQLVGVGPVGFGARWADRGAAVPAGHVDDAVGQVGGVPGFDDAAGVGFDGVELAGEADGVVAAAGAGGVGEPALQVG